MQLIFFNVKSQEQFTYEIDDNVVSDVENTKVLLNGEVYSLVNTVPDEIKALNKLRSDFEDTEFENLYQTKFAYEKKEDIPQNFLELFTAAIEEPAIKEKYAEFFKSIEENKAQVYKTLSNHYLTYMFMKKRFTQIIDKNKSEMMHPAYSVDFCLRFAKLFKETNWKEEKTLKDVSEKLDTLRKYMDIDDRRHAGHDRILEGVGRIATAVSTLLTDNNISIISLKDMEKDREKYGKIWDDLTSVFKTVYKYYDDLVEETKNTIEKIKTIDPDKHIGYLKVAKPIVIDFLQKTDKYFKEASQIEENDKAKLDLVKKEYIEALHTFYTNLNGLFMAYDADTREDTSEKAKEFNALWESSIYYKDNSGANDWFIQLAKLLYNSYNDLFGEILTDVEKVQFTKKES